MILHEEAEDGNPMPDLSRPVHTVSRAVENLTKVGKDTINRSDDEILRADMPNSLARVERASNLLEAAAKMLLEDPYSQQARHLLIEGSRGILQGTSSLLLCFDESEVRKLIRSCRRVLNYMEVVEVIEKNDDLYQFAKDLTPALSKLTRDINQRQRELTHQAHREILLRCLENLRQEAPILISSMKIYIQLLISSGSQSSEAAQNRNYHTQRIADELEEIIRVLQLTTYDDDEWDSDSLSYMKRALGAMTSKIQSAHDWLEDPLAPNGGIGEKALRQILEHAERIADRSSPQDRALIRKQTSDIRAMLNGLCELRASNQASSAQAQSLARNIGIQLRDLLNSCTRAIANLEMGGNPQPAHTLSGRMDQGQRWLKNLAIDDHGLGEQAVRAITEDARLLAHGCQVTSLRNQMLECCQETEVLNKQLVELIRRGQAQSAGARSASIELQAKLHKLHRYIQAALVSQVVDELVDASLPLDQFTEIVLSSSSTSHDERTRLLFNERARNLTDWSKRARSTANHVAVNRAQNKRLAESINSTSDRIESQTPQLINAGQIRFDHANNKSAHENFIHMRDQYENLIVQLRNLIDEAIDSGAFVRASEQAILRHTKLCELAISTRQFKSMSQNASAIAKLANRVIMVAKQEANNSEDGAFIARTESATGRLNKLMPEMVGHAKDVAANIADIRNHGQWRKSNNELIEAVRLIGDVLGPSEIGADVSRLLGADNSQNKYNTQQTTTTTRTTITTTDIIDQQDRAYQQQHQKQQHPHLHSHTQPNSTPTPRQQQQMLYNTPDPYNTKAAGSRSPRAASGQSPAASSPLGSAQQRTRPAYNDVATDDEEEGFPTLQPNEPIMMAAHDLHQEVKQWSSKENEIIAAAKKIALLMALLSQLVRGESGTKKDLISCAKAIAEASQEVTRLAKEQAKLCTDRRMRTNILQVCERIATMGPQLGILSTVKATMLGVQGSQEDQEAMDMIVGNAQNLMQSIKETVRACEAASIKIRTDQGVRVRWIRKEPWYT